MAHPRPSSGVGGGGGGGSSVSAVEFAYAAAKAPGSQKCTGHDKLQVSTKAFFETLKSCSCVFLRAVVHHKDKTSTMRLGRLTTNLPKTEV